MTKKPHVAGKSGGRYRQVARNKHMNPNITDRTPAFAGQPVLHATPPHLLSTAEAARLLTLRESTIRDYARRGLVPSLRIGRHVRFLEADLYDYLESRRTQAQNGRSVTASATPHIT